MAEADVATAPLGAPAWLLDVALVATLAFFGLGLTAGVDGTALALGLTVHVLVSIYHGRFGRLRTMSWVVLVGGWATSVMIGFLAYVLPWGQMSFWLATRLGALAPVLFQSNLLTSLPTAIGIAALLGTVVDVVALHGPRLRTSRVTRLVAILAAAVVVGLAVRDVIHLTAALDGPVPAQPTAPTPRILPSTEFLPFYAILRAVPSKNLGVALMFAMMILPIMWPWRRAWRFHAAPTRRIYALLWLAAAGGWFGLGMLGAKAPETGVVIASRVLVVYELAFLTLVPIVLAPWLPPAEDRRAEVFV